MGAQCCAEFRVAFGRDGHNSLTKTHFRGQDKTRYQNATLHQIIRQNGHVFHQGPEGGWQATPFNRASPGTEEEGNGACNEEPNHQVAELEVERKLHIHEKKQ